MGRFDDSIKAYERAHSLDPTFVASYVGIGNAHLHARRIERAREAFAKIASLPPEIKEATRRTHVFEEGRVAVAKGELRTARARSDEYARLVAPRKAAFEIRQQHELAGLIALAEKRGAAAVEEFMASNQQDPRILYLTALAWKEAGDARKAAAFAEKAAKCNGLAFSSAYVSRRMKDEGSHARGGEQASAISLMCLWSVPQHPPSTLRCGHAFRSSRY